MSEDPIRRGRPPVSQEAQAGGDSPFLNFTMPRPAIAAMQEAAAAAGQTRAAWARHVLITGTQAQTLPQEAPDRGPANRVVNVRVPAQLLTDLQHLADEAGVSRAAAARALVLHALGGEVMNHEH